MTTFTYVFIVYFTLLLITTGMHLYNGWYYASNLIVIIRGICDSVIYLTLATLCFTVALFFAVRLFHSL